MNEAAIHSFWSAHPCGDDIVGGPHLSADPAQSAPHAHISALRSALTSVELGESVLDQARPVTDLAKLLTGPIEQAWRRNDYETDVTRLIGGVGRNAAKLSFAVLSMFFLLRDGPRLMREARAVLEGILGPRVHDYIDAAGYTTQAVVYALMAIVVAPLRVLRSREGDFDHRLVASVVAVRE